MLSQSIIAAAPSVPAPIDSQTRDHTFVSRAEDPILAAPFPLAVAELLLVEDTLLLPAVLLGLVVLVADASADVIALLILLAWLLAAESPVADACPLLVSQNGKQDEVTDARLLERSDEKLDSQLKAAAPVKVVVIPLLTSTTDCAEATVMYVKSAMLSCARIFE